MEIDFSKVVGTMWNTEDNDKQCCDVIASIEGMMQQRCVNRWPGFQCGHRG